MTPLAIGIAGFGALTLLIVAGMHISTALLLVAFVGTALIRDDWDLAGSMLGQAATDAVTEYEFGTVPLFVLMGFLAMVGGVGRDAYAVAHRLLHRVPGGLGHATVAGNALFAAITGISVASAALFTRLAVPEMLARGWRPRLAVGIVAGSSMLGMLIPPSLLMIVYAVLTETSVGDIYTAGIVPGLILTAAFMGAIWLIAKWRPEWVGEGPRRAVRPPRPAWRTTRTEARSRGCSRRSRRWCCWCSAACMAGCSPRPRRARSARPARSSSR
jgi:tripartite ATP-independent transporter DctM subunit